MSAAAAHPPRHSNDGLTAATAWKTIGKINSATFATGDRVYLLAGDTFTGSGAASFNVAWSGTSATHAMLGAYHTDAGGNAVIGLGSAARLQFTATWWQPPHGAGRLATAVPAQLKILRIPIRQPAHIRLP